jgi:hypothetical protein
MTVMSPGAMPQEMRTRVVCRIFIKAAPEDVRNAICFALEQNESAGSARLSVELRDTLTGYTSLTVSCDPDGEPGAPARVAAGAYEWERLLGDLKTVLEAAGRDRSPRRPRAPAAARSPLPGAG